MLPGKIGTGSCEASCGSELQGSVEAVASKKTGSLTLVSKKKSRPISGRLKVEAWNLIPQRLCTAVTLFAAIRCDDRQQAVDSSVTCATHWRHIDAVAGG